jgi:hypothetical protein
MIASPTTLINSTRPTSAVLTLGKSSLWSASLLAIGGLFVLYHGFVFHGCIGVGVALLFGTTQKGVELDIQAQRYRFFTLIIGFRIGSWEPLPNIQRVVMKYYSDLVTHGRPGRMRTDSDRRYIVMLSVPNSTQGIIIHETYGYEPAMKLTQALADFLGVEVKVYDKIG